MLLFCSNNGTTVVVRALCFFVLVGQLQRTVLFFAMVPVGTGQKGHLLRSAQVGGKETQPWPCFEIFGHLDFFLCNKNK